LRGSAGFAPASLLVKADEDAQTKEVVKDLNWIVGKIYSLAEGKSINPRCVAWSRTDLNGKFPF